MLRTTLATAFLASTIPFITSNNLTNGQEKSVGSQPVESKGVTKEEQLKTQGFLIDFKDDLLLRDIKQSLSGLEVERIRVFDRPKNKYYVSIKTAQLWKDLARVMSESKGVEKVGTPPINPNLPDITEEFNCIGKKVHEPKYINPKDSSSKIQIQNGSALIVQTNRYAVVPAFLGGTLKVRLEGDTILRHFNPEDGKSFFVGSTNDGKLGNFIPSTLFLAEGSGLTKLTVTFCDKEGKEREKTTYNIEVTGKK